MSRTSNILAISDDSGVMPPTIPEISRPLIPALGMTRWLLRKAERRETNGGTAICALAGLLAGVLLLIGLAATCTVGIQIANRLSQGNGGPQLLDLAATLHRLHTQPGDPSLWWICFTLFSTLLPTAAHIVVAAASVVLWRLPDRWKAAWQAEMNAKLKEDFIALVNLARWLTALDALAVVLGLAVVALLTMLAVLGLPWLGTGLLWLCEQVAQMLGPPVTPPGVACVAPRNLCTIRAD
jgi:hypothetical protein